MLAIPAQLTSLNACFEAADHLVKAAEAEAKALHEDMDASETEDLKVALGAGGTGKGAAGAARGSAGVLKSWSATEITRDPAAARRPGSRAGRPGQLLPRRAAGPGRI